MGRNVRAVPLVHHRARRLRREQTEAERKLWDRLRSEELSEFRFRRQFVIEEFIADFACTKARLVIELDGAHHLNQTAKDEWRTRIIERHGFRVLRFWDSEVLIDVDAVIERIVDALGEGGGLEKPR